MTSDPLVLVVDDVAQNVRLLEAVLSPKGFRVATASSGEQALDVLNEEHPDIVLLDILRVIGNSPAQAFADLHLIVSKVLIPARRA